MHWLARDTIIHERTDEVLKHVSQLIDGRLIAAFLKLLLQKVIILDDCLITIGQIVFRS